MEYISDPKIYRESFKNKVNSTHMEDKTALDWALDIRKFEIELYWKRAAYFWAFIAIAYTGYVSLQKNNIGGNFELIHLICCLGLLLSISWYFVNRGSKYWQENWELHVDLLENNQLGPLFKTTVSKRKYPFCHIFSAYPFSVSKINQILSMLSVIVWIALMIHNIFYICLCNKSHRIILFTLTPLTILFVIILFVKGKANRDREDKSFEFEKRKYVGDEDQKQ